MKTTKYEDLKMGQSAEVVHTVTENDIQTFGDLSGDYNPLHFDENFASKTKFGKLVGQGGITTGILHAIVAMDLPGPGTVFLNQNFQFTAPVFIGDTITGTAEVYEIHKSKPVTKLNVKVVNQRKETVLEGKVICYSMDGI